MKVAPLLTYKNRLPQSALMGYISPAPHKTGAGTATPLTIRAHSRASGFFTCKASSRLFIRIMAGRTGEPQGSPGSLVAGRCSPVRLATPSLQPLGGELSQFTTRGYPSWQTVNNASATPAPTFSASIPGPKSTADCTAPAASPASCTSTCCTNGAALSHRRISPPFLAIWLTICANCSNWSASLSTPCNTPPPSPLFVRGVCASC